MMDETLLHVGDPARGRRWQDILPPLVPGLVVRQFPDTGDLAAIRYVAGWAPDAALLASLPALAAVFSVGAGVDHVDPAVLPPGVPLVRMIEPGLVRGVVEYAVFGVLALHRDMLTYIDQQRRGDWTTLPRQPASARRIGVIGLGQMGAAIATELAGFGYPVAGWSRSAHAIDGIETFAGQDALPAFLARTDILVCILPLTDATRGIIDAALLARLPKGASIVNVGRGGHVDEDALIAAIDGGHIAGAVLDVAQQEPLPRDHPFWAHPRILMTPHIAGTTDAAAGARVVADNILRHRRGQELTGVVDTARGY